MVRPSIIDPHGHHLRDALDKLRALASYAKKYGDQFTRIESLPGTTIADLKRVDFKDPTVRDVVDTAITAAGVYERAGRPYKRVV